MLTQCVEPAALLPIKLKSSVGTLARQLRALARTNRDVAHVSLLQGHNLKFLSLTCYSSIVFNHSKYSIFSLFSMILTKMLPKCLKYFLTPQMSQN